MTMDKDCAEARTLLHADIDGELDAANAMRLDGHIAGCSACTAERAGLLALSAAIRGRATHYSAPDALRRSLTRTLTPATPIIRRPRYWPAMGTGFGLGTAMAAGIAIFINLNVTHDSDMNGVVAAHIRALQPGHLTDVQVTDQHIVKPWFDGKVDFAPPVKDLTEQGFDLTGGRLDYIDNRNAAVIVYRRRLHLIDLFITRGETAGPSGVAATPSGYNVERWSQNGLDYWAVSDLNRQELTDFVQLWRGR